MDINTEHFRHSLPIQIRFNDIDAIGHINNNIYFSYFDLGKTYYFEDLKASYVSWTEGIIVVARIETDFLSPIYYKESIVVETKVKKIGTKSFTLLQQIRNVKTQEIKCRCTSIIVAYNAQLQTSMDIPDVWRDGISVYEGTDF
ncbi:acyl-CoA thioesterase [Dysgonomonas sp. 216]|uniref:acyl-CoA thioesterase n=1 Tax=Dysgonomonas sp. 216 TaxID=2302934 RepID=UPI0013D2533E|nr:thioesterase family protein [Dysgonomonas sp. 216]NDW19615.1 acyl-CoA thioesterase [Dysgonomonas sp. 216]